MQDSLARVEQSDVNLGTGALVSRLGSTECEPSSNKIVKFHGAQGVPVTPRGQGGEQNDQLRPQKQAVGRTHASLRSKSVLAPGAALAEASQQPAQMHRVAL